MKLLVVGDVSATEITAEYFEKEDIGALFSDAVSLFEGVDFKVANLECAVTNSENPIEKIGPNLKAPSETAKVLAKVGFDLVSLSNNHIFDYGKEGYRDTVKALDDAGVAHTGFGENYQDSRRNYVFEKDGQKVCIIAVCEHEYSYALDDRMGSRPFDCYDTIADVRRAKENCDRVVVMYHGGKEHCRYPSPRMVKLCRALVDNGADVVVGQHSHCICCYEEYNGGHILYGQGNFHFVCDYPNLPDWPHEMAMIYDADANTVNFVPTTQTATGIELAKGEKLKEIEKTFKTLCEEMKSGEWYNGWKDFCDQKTDYYNLKLSQVFETKEKPAELFAHLLDCEAHHDVITQMYKTKNHTNEK